MEVTELEKRSQEEFLKEESNFLRGTIQESLRNPLTGALTSDDAKLIKFHGSYQQHDRDLERERQRQKLEPLYQFMVRVRATGGITTPEQWRVLDELADRYASGSLKLTTRQSFQFHGILKPNLQSALKAVNDALLTTIATCGDINRNVMCNPNPYQSPIHEEVYEYAKHAGEYFKPKSRAYYEIWLNESKIEGTEEHEPIYNQDTFPASLKLHLLFHPIMMWMFLLTILALSPLKRTES